MSELNTELKKAIDGKAPEVIKLVDELAKKPQYRKPIGSSGGKKGGKRQFTDLVAAAAQACCIDEFKLYIKYKAAKEGTRGVWYDLADPFNAKVDDLMKTVADEIKQNDETVRLEVLKRFCGYLMWRAHADIAAQGGG